MSMDDTNLSDRFAPNATALIHSSTTTSALPDGLNTLTVNARGHFQARIPLLNVIPRSS